MQRYHILVEGIPEYFNMLEDAQRQAGRAGRTITDDTLLVFASTGMLTSESFLRANDNLEDRAERDKTWAMWKLAYKQAHAKARFKAQATEGSTKFGVVNSAARQEPHLPLDNQLEEDSSDVNTLKGYFDNLAAAATNKKDVLKQLVLNNTTLATSNGSLVALIKKEQNEIKNLERELSRFKKPVQSSARNYPTLCVNCKKRDTTIPKIATSWLKIKTSVPQVGEALCDGGGRKALII